MDLVQSYKSIDCGAALHSDHQAHPNFSGGQNRYPVLLDGYGVVAIAFCEILQGVFRGQREIKKGEGNQGR